MANGPFPRPALHLLTPKFDPHLLDRRYLALKVLGEEIDGAVGPLRRARDHDVVLLQYPQVLLHGLVVEGELLSYLVGVQGLVLQQLHYPNPVAAALRRKEEEHHHSFEGGIEPLFLTAVRHAGPSSLQRAVNDSIEER